MLRERANEDLRDILEAQEKRIASLTGGEIKAAAITFFDLNNYARFVLKPQE